MNCVFCNWFRLSTRGREHIRVEINFALSVVLTMCNLGGARCERLGQHYIHRHREWICDVFVVLFFLQGLPIALASSCRCTEPFPNRMKMYAKTFVLCFLYSFFFVLIFVGVLFAHLPLSHPVTLQATLHSTTRDCANKIHTDYLHFS